MQPPTLHHVSDTVICELFDELQAEIDLLVNRPRVSMIQDVEAAIFVVATRRDAPLDGGRSGPNAARGPDGATH